jgi:transposase-like protein
MAKPDAFKIKPTERQNRIFSESFRKAKVREIERNLTTVTMVSREYEVNRTAVYKWLWKYSSLRAKQIRQIVEPMSDTHKIAELRKKIKELEQLVGQKQIQIEFKEKMIELAEQMYGVDIKKKLGSKRSSGSGSSEKNTGGK